MPGGILVAAPPPSVPEVRPPEIIRLTWTSPAGRVTEFDNSMFGNATMGYVTLPGAIGLDMPEYTAYTDTSPVLDGELFRGVRTEARNLAIPVLFYGDDLADHRRLRSELFFDMQPPRRANIPLGYLSVIRPNGTTRTIEAYYVDGLQGSLDGVEQSHNWLKAVIGLRAPAPYFLGQQVDRVIPFGKTGSWIPYGVGSPGHNYQVSSNQILGDLDIVNAGDVVAFPTFTIHGPATYVHLINNSTGEQLRINQALDADDVLVVNCTDGRKSVKLNGTNIRSKVTLTSPVSTLWAFDPGLNEVSFNLPGATTATVLTFSYRERFLAGW